MNGNSKPAGRSRPTNNQLLYKAHFRWKHYTSPLAPGVELPDGTEACASVTSAFLQVLATIHRAESCRSDKARNILAILSSNTRRTKVVELGAGTHRVADELRRHCLADGEGGHYSTNLDRNRYGSDNNYLFTVTKFNLDCLGLCPCLVDIEIIDTRNGNESQLERADASQFQGSLAGQRPNASPHDMRRVASTGHISGMKRVPSAPAMRRPPSSGRLHMAEHHAGERGGTQSGRNSGGGSELFDALLMAAEEDRAAGGHAEPPVTSVQYPSVALARQRSRGGAWAFSGEVDSLQNAIEAFKGADEEVATGGLARGRSRRMLRRNSVSMIIENPVLAQTGAAESLLLNHYPPFQALPPLRSPVQAGQAAAGAGGGDPAEPSVRSHEGDTGSMENEQEVGSDKVDDHASFREGLLRHYHKQSSAVNLSRLTNPTELRRLQEELRQLREENRGLESELEEWKMREREARDKEAAKAGELSKAQVLTRRAVDLMQRLKGRLGKQAQPEGSAAATAAAEGTIGSPSGAPGGDVEMAEWGKAAAAGPGVGEDAGLLAGLQDLAALEEELGGVRNSEQEIAALKSELELAKRVATRADAERREAEGRLVALTQALGGPAAAAAVLRHAAAVAAAAGLPPGPAALALGPGGHPGMPAAYMGYGPPAAMFGMPQALHPAYAVAGPGLSYPSGGGGAHHRAGSMGPPMPKVASMPTLGPGVLHPHTAHLPPIAPLGPGDWPGAFGGGGGGGGRERDSAGRKRRGGGASPIPEDEPDDPPRKRRSSGGGRTAGAAQRPTAAPEQGGGEQEEGAGESEGGAPVQEEDTQEGGNSSGGPAAAGEEGAGGEGQEEDELLGGGTSPVGSGSQRRQQQQRGAVAAKGPAGEGLLAPVSPEGRGAAPRDGVTPKEAGLLGVEALPGGVGPAEAAAAAATAEEQRSEEAVKQEQALADGAELLAALAAH